MELSLSTSALKSGVPSIEPGRPGFPFRRRVLIRDAHSPGQLTFAALRTIIDLCLRAPNLGDILANAITHGIGAGLAMAGAVCLIAASTRGSARLIVSCSVFSGALVLVYLCSTLYHSLGRTRARHVFHVLDHSAIYVLIAGTYTPFTLVSLRGPLGWVLFAVVWSLAVAGVVFKSLASRPLPRGFDPRLSVAGLARNLRRALASPRHRLAWDALALAGGMAYTLGIIFFALDRLRLLPRGMAHLRSRRQRSPLLRHLLYVVPARPIPVF